MNQQLKKVILVGLGWTLLTGLAMGVLNSVLIEYFKTYLLGLIFFLAYIIAIKIKSSYYQYQKAYSVLAVVFTILGFHLSNYVVGIIISRDIYAGLAQGLIMNFMFLWPFWSGFFNISNILNVVFFIVACVMAWRYSK